MSLSFPCPHCQSPITFEPDDLGFEVYCRSCGRVAVAPSLGGNTTVGEERAGSESVESDAPTAAPSSATAERRVSVFASQAVEQLQERILGMAKCLCGRANPYALADVELGYLYCASCGAEVAVGERLQEKAAAVAQTMMPLMVAPRSRSSLLRSLVSLGVLTVSCALSLFGLHFTRHTWTPVMMELGILPPSSDSAPTRPALAEFTTANEEKQLIELAPSPRRQGTGAADAPPFDPNELNLSMIETTANGNDPFQALIQLLAWQNELRRHEIPVDDERQQRLATLPKGLVEKRRPEMLALIDRLEPGESVQETFDQAQTWAEVLRRLELPKDDPLRVRILAQSRRLLEAADPITLEMINDLLRLLDPTEGVVQARLWEDALRARGAAEGDPRWPRLTEVIAKLLDRMKEPPSADPAVVEEFQTAIQKVLDSLARRDFDAAQAAMKPVEAMVERHNATLGPFLPRYLMAKSVLRSMAIKLKGADDVRRLFREAAEKLATAEGRVTEVEAYSELVSQALKLDANARMNVFRGRWKQAEIAEFEKLSTDTKQMLKFARGVRAVLDAEHCEANKDPIARNREVLRAYSLLPGFPESRVERWLTRVKKWRDEANTSQTTNATTPHGQKIDARESFEACLEPYATANLEQLIVACNAADRANSNRHQQLGQLVFEAMEMRLGQLLNSSKTADDLVLANDVRTARRTLAQAGAWSDDPRGKALLTLVDQQAIPLARRAIEKATKFAEKGELESAIELIAPAVDLASGSQREFAEALRKKWQDALDLSKNLEAQRNQWRLIEKHRDAGRSVEALVELNKFLATWPDAEQRRAADQLHKELQERLRGVLAAELQKLESDAAQDRWPVVARRLPLLVVAAAAANPDQRKMLARLEQDLDHRRKQAAATFQLLGSKKKLASDTDVLDVQRACLMLLSVDPEHAEARSLLTKARERGGKFAAQLVKNAKMWRQLGEDAFRARMEKAVELDPDGENGRDARRLISEL